MKRANAVMECLALEVDMARASVEPVALEQLLACSQFHRLPAHIDPLQADCGLSIPAPWRCRSTRPGHGTGGLTCRRGATRSPAEGQQLAGLGTIHNEQLLLDPDCTQTGIMGRRHPFCPST
ncbi:hypothetical protein [Pseudarthrobacter sp. PvP090]|uniref:hypothetical protein n=1 Tax=Pseudarthrobacter sp. PvP090 TaxID=3156393 RepID=UPI0033994F7A